ncbi:MAG: acyl-CoA dehydrogenase family protein, partial [Actinomycetota bacterium]
MQLADQAQDAAFRREVQAWFQTHVIGDFAAAQGRGGQGDEAFEPELRRAWEKELARGGWTCVGWPTQFGGRGASITQQVIFNEEYVRYGAPGRFSILGEGLLGP